LVLDPLKIKRGKYVIRHPSSVILIASLVLFSGCYEDGKEMNEAKKTEAPLTFAEGSNLNMEQTYAWAQSEPNAVKAGNLFLKANLSRTTAVRR
jgi:hypothetical protein